MARAIVIEGGEYGELADGTVVGPFHRRHGCFLAEGGTLAWGPEGSVWGGAGRDDPRRVSRLFSTEEVRAALAARRG